MKLTLIGGAGFRVPQVIEAVARSGPVDELALVDTDPGRLRTILDVAAQLPAARGLKLTAGTDLAEGLTGTDFVLSLSMPFLLPFDQRYKSHYLYP